MSKLTLGPVQFHWSAAQRRDFYARMADESPISCAYLGEVVCSKRLPWFENDLTLIAERLQRAGKQVVFSTPALITTDREVSMIASICQAAELIEVNDLACISLLNGKEFVSGPLVNVFNEGTLDVLIGMGAVRINAPIELSAPAIATLASKSSVEIEVFAFGRQPLAISQRCYHARARDLHKDNCQFVCGEDVDGMEVAQLNGRPILTINGTQTLSYGHVTLLKELAALQASEVTHFRLSPHALDMVEIATVYRAVLDGTFDAEEGLAKLREIAAPIPFINGYLHGHAGMEWLTNFAN